MRIFKERYETNFGVMETEFFVSPSQITEQKGVTVYAVFCRKLGGKPVIQTEDKIGRVMFEDEATGELMDGYQGEGHFTTRVAAEAVLERIAKLRKLDCDPCDHSGPSPACAAPPGP